MKRAALALLLAAAPGLAGCLAPAAPDALGPAGVAGSVFSSTSVFRGDYDLTGPYARPLIAGTLGILAPEIVEIASDLDGATIQMGIVRPDVPEGTRVPVVVVASPYYRPLTPERVAENPANEMHMVWTFNHYDYYARSLVSHGYAVVFLATRGTADSGGCAATMFGPGEPAGADLDQAVRWLGEQAWSNGNVGMTGISSEANAGWVVAALGNPYLKTIVPVVGFTDWGTYMADRTSTPAELAVGYAVWGPYGFVHNNLANGRSAEHIAEGVPCTADETTAAAYTMALASRDDPAGFWAARNSRPGVEASYGGSVFIVNGILDNFGAMRQSYPWLQELEARGTVVKHLLGQWTHSYPDYRIFRGDHPAGEAIVGVQDEDHKRWDYGEILLRWLERWLKEDASVDIGPAAQVQDSQARWRNEATWPPRDAEPVRFGLGADGVLASDGPATPGTALLCPRAARPLPDAAAPACPGALRFATASFADEFRFAGSPALSLSVTPMGPGSQLRATLLVRTGDAAQVLGVAVTDLRLADGTGEPAPVRPGRAIVALMTFEPLDVVVPPGGVLELRLEQDAAADAPQALPLAPIEVRLGGEAGALEVQAFARGPEAFFEPPGVAS